MMIIEMLSVCTALSMGYVPRSTDAVHALVYIQRSASGLVFESVDHIMFLSMIVTAEIDILLYDQHEYIRGSFYVGLYCFLISASEWNVKSPLFSLVPLNLGRWSTFKMFDGVRLLVNIWKTVSSIMASARVRCGIIIDSLNGNWRSVTHHSQLQSNSPELYTYDKDDNLKIFVGFSEITNFFRSMETYRKGNLFGKALRGQNRLSEYLYGILSNGSNMVSVAIRLNPDGFRELLEDKVTCPTGMDKKLYNCALLLILFVFLRQNGVQVLSFDGKRHSITVSPSRCGTLTDEQCAGVISSSMKLIQR